jgi:putative membrane protein
MKSRDMIRHLRVFFCGILMGIADAIPGISGGTIALLLGIYEELIGSISNFNINLFRNLKKKGIKYCWNKINGNFLLSLITGVLLSLVSFVKIFSILIEKYPLFIWSFFLGLILATLFVINRNIKKWDISNFILIFIFAFLTILLSIINPSISENINLFYILICGIIASSAMILPGISGSLILVILGVYTLIINALNNLEYNIILVFLIGCLIGIINFSKIIKWLFNNYRDYTFSIMLGLVIGSIYTVWPWRKSFTDHVTNEYIFLSVIITIIGFAVIYTLEKINKK